MGFVKGHGRLAFPTWVRDGLKSFVSFHIHTLRSDHGTMASRMEIPWRDCKIYLISARFFPPRIMDRLASLAWLLLVLA